MSKKKGYKITKRLFDIFMSSLILIVTFPIILIVCICIRVESKGNPFYKQERVGLNGKKINIYKLRSMYLDAEAGGPKWADKDDDRITCVGKIIRKTRIDELPQLINVLNGDMSLIGPRPEREVFINEFLKENENFNDRLQVLPGLSGYAQVNGGYDITHHEKFELDMYYINNMSLLLDIKIIFKTILVVFTGSGAR
ncbi:MAG: exopolysaccharide biosynthesis polyprenyl glycosylphosphotransferase [Vagococcus sp.]|uniref:exopolysaccharide biosynthesis polyprenyl glycosylphosphotransferase n=1 Tax=Vagococcus sp. TaxID=1933889 RepID=UPI002FC9A762